MLTTAKGPSLVITPSSPNPRRSVPEKSNSDPDVVPTKPHSVSSIDVGAGAGAGSGPVKRRKPPPVPVRTLQAAIRISSSASR